MAEKSGPLSGTIVIDVTAGLAGPYGTFLLPSMGAHASSGLKCPALTMTFR